eukprot:Rhum_TRINITY_DN18852_c0_g1::Rhum_TRINITY_DN18852_c0_g1_i1::g.168598::m.168598/K12405/HSD17B4; 3-hydroxyacyl-CoA dehydrogenase / 3a,7a,12a-trihydroxy-5b-cholest-24-enoyl-CoA hydratase / enoyl-CoA hydratase 2
MSTELRFDGRVAIVTGAGQGLGKAYALELARRGASVVVNDLGASVKGTSGDGDRVADQVVAEIRAVGGKAAANYDSVEFGEKIVATAIENFGRIDIVINNAGILRDRSFKKMTDNDWDLIMAVHLKGAYAVSKAAWPHMLEQKFGRILCTASAAGLFGNVGQANYACAKMGLVGFAQTLGKEGAKNNVFCNAIAPVAGTRMTATVMPPAVVAGLKPEYVVPMSLYLCHDSSKANASFYEVGAGTFFKLQLVRSEGWVCDVTKEDPTVESVAANWKQIENTKKHSLIDPKTALMKNPAFVNLSKMQKHREAQAKL